MREEPQDQKAISIAEVEKIHACPKKGRDDILIQGFSLINHEYKIRSGKFLSNNVNVYIFTKHAGIDQEAVVHELYKCG